MNEPAWITDAAKELAMDSAHVPLIAAIISRHAEPIRSAAENALAAWDSGTEPMEHVMIALRSALNGQTKTK